MVSGTLKSPKGRVLSTLNENGTRRWLTPKVSDGRFLSARRALAWLLIALFVGLPWLRIHGEPQLLLDVMHRKFYFLGTVFTPVDSPLLMVWLLGTFVAIFLFTALWGRVWCGWGCPQTVYLEFVFRPIERLFTKKGGGTKLGKVGMYVSYAIVSVILGNTFLAYFVPTETLVHWVTTSPSQHPAGFLVMAVTCGLMMFDFAYFREQMCVVACPYARLQSVLLDRQSLIIGYDAKRGEPRGKLAGRAEGSALGDCIDCRACVVTCPTGIDIREGLQMECVGCAQCIDACDAIMHKVNKPIGLIRYAAQTELEEGRGANFVRPRTVIYVALCVIAAVAFGLLMAHRGSADVEVLRGRGAPFVVLEDGRVQNFIKLELTNRSATDIDFQVAVLNEPRAEVVVPQNPIHVGAGARMEAVAFVLAQPEMFEAGPAYPITLHVWTHEFERDLPFTLMGPQNHVTQEKKHHE